MKITTDKGYSMTSSLKMEPYTYKVLRDHARVPPHLKGWHIHILGRADEHIEFHGTVAELHKLKQLIDDSIAMIDKREAGA